MGMVSGEVLERIRAATDIVELIGACFPLRRSGRTFEACCPFHEERTPSFKVNPQRQIFKCFGCGKGGDVFTFVRDYHHLEFLEAVELLAERAHIPIQKASSGPRGPARGDLLSVLAWAAERYRRNLVGPEGRACRDYVTSRGIQSSTAESFLLGYAPPGGRHLVHLAAQEGRSEDLLLAAGLAARKARGEALRDRFWDARLIFPIKNAQGQVVAFGGRSLDGNEPKYLNSPETRLFQKGRLLYGLERLAGHPRAAPILVVEGYTDVIIPAQLGVKGVVATLGTALTPNHARLLARYSDHVVLVYDGDKAGLAAAERGAQVLLKGGHLQLKVAVLPEGQDPCDYSLARGPKASQEILEGALDLVDFLVSRMAARHGTESVAGRHQCASELVRLVADLEDPVARELVLERVAGALQISSSVLQEKLATTRGFFPKNTLLPREPPQERSGGLRERAQREILEALVNKPLLISKLDPGVLDTLPEGLFRTILEQLLSQGAEPPLTTSELLASFTKQEQRVLLEEALLEDPGSRELEAQLEGALLCLKNRHIRESAREARERGLQGEDPEGLEAFQERMRLLKLRSRQRRL